MTQCIQQLSMTDFIAIALIATALLIGMTIGILLGRRRQKPVAAPIALEPKKAKRASNVPPKYVGPSGETWHGKGREPSWMKELIEAGRSKEDFINPERLNT